MVDSGIILIKYWLEVSMEEQTRRLEARIDDGRAVWKLSPSIYSPIAAVRLLAVPTDVRLRPTPAWAPGYVAPLNDKKRARLNIISHLPEPALPTRKPPREKVELPKRQKPGR